MRHRIIVSACALAVLAGSTYGQISWQQKSRVEQARLIWGVDGTGVLLGQIELSTGRRTHEAFADGAGNKVDFRLLTDAANVSGDHPTRVAGIMGGNSATFKGAAPGVRFAWTDWTETNAANPLTLSNDFLNKTNWFLTAPVAPIVNMSAGIRGNLPGDTAATTARLNQLRTEHQRIADWTVDRGILFVAAAGNSGPGVSTVLSPGSGYNVLTVGATGDTNATGAMIRNWDQIGAFSSRGPVDQPWSGGLTRRKPDLVAPGANIFSSQTAADNSYGTTTATNNEAATGTSFAAPQVAGAAALLRQLAGGNADGKDPRVVRAILMNSTNKTVRDDAGTRWDEIPGLGRGTANVSDQLGTGRLDALAAARQLAEGQSRPTLGTGGTGLASQGTGWDKGTLNGVGEAFSNDYLTDTPLRKGSYITATLVWNRHMTIANAGAAPSDVTYDGMNDLDLGVAKLGSIGTILQRSNSGNDAREHMVYKVGNADADRTNYYIRAWQFNHGSTQANEQYGLAWRSAPAPVVNTLPQSYNGTFNPGLSAPVDDGWYKTAGTPRVGEKPWDNIDATSGRIDSTYAMELRNNDIMTQELTAPRGGFDIMFTFGFTTADGQLKILLDGLNLLDYDSLPGSTIDASAASIGLSSIFTDHIDFSGDAEAWAHLGSLDFTELSFQSTGLGLAYIDNISYVPTPGGLVLVGFGMALVGRRRRR